MQFADRGECLAAISRQGLGPFVLLCSCRNAPPLWLDADLCKLRLDVG